MPELRTLSGKEVVKIFPKFGFEVTSQKGSHVKLRRVLPKWNKTNFNNPLHKELDKGTLKAIIRQASRYILSSLKSLLDSF
ncbi:type II toxin-antitoxin system HicA family toxin [Archaeoglobales archaeon]|nr:MAG: type II toxin-antitoxin system HicA family toxin [Archaeoglobales archaeon]